MLFSLNTGLEQYVRSPSYYNIEVLATFTPNIATLAET
jgi:hypothetical protein